MERAAGPLHALRFSIQPCQVGDHAATTDTHSIVMATQGRGGLAHYWRGSVADVFVKGIAARELIQIICAVAAGAGISRPAWQPACWRR
jgi:hypothetical protein